MTTGTERDPIRRSVLTATQTGDVDTIRAETRAMTRRDWLLGEPRIRRALAHALRTLPDTTPTTVAELARAIAEWVTGAEISRLIIEAVVREAVADPRPAQHLPPDIVDSYALLVVGYLIHRGNLTLDEAMGADEYELDPFVVRAGWVAEEPAAPRGKAPMFERIIDSVDRHHGRLDFAPPASDRVDTEET